MLIRTALNAPAGIAAFLPRIVAPDWLGKRAAWTDVWDISEGRVTEASGTVTTIANLADAANPLVQSTEADRAEMIMDDILGRKVLDFGDAYSDYMASTLPRGYAENLSLVVVSRGPIDTGKTFATDIGRYAASGTDRAAIVERSNGEVAAMYGDATPFPGHPSLGDVWQVKIMSVRIADKRVGFRLNNSGWEYATATTVPTTTVFQLGYNAEAGATSRAKYAFAARANVDLSDNPAELRALVDVLRYRFGGNVVL